jgi:hypothetical protein
MWFDGYSLSASFRLISPVSQKTAKLQFFVAARRMDIFSGTEHLLTFRSALMNHRAIDRLLSLSDEQIRKELGRGAENLSREELLAAAKFVEELGGLECAQAAIETLHQIRRAA